MTTFLVSIVTLALGGFITYLLGNKSKEPYWCIRTSTLLRKKTCCLKKLVIQFGTEEITTFSMSRIALWNHGKKLINNQQDKIVGEELKIIPSKNTKILEVTVIANNNKSHGNDNICGFEILDQEDQGAKIINFDTMERNQGCVLQVIHTGAGSQDIKIRGKFKDSKALKNIFYNKKMFLKGESIDFTDQETDFCQEPMDYIVGFSLYYPLITLIAVSLIFFRASFFNVYPMIQLPTGLKFLYPGANPVVQFSTNFVLQRNVEKILYPLFFLIFLSAAYYWAKVSGILTRRMIPTELIKHI